MWDHYNKSSMWVRMEFIIKPAANPRRAIMPIASGLKSGQYVQNMGG